MDLPDGYNVCLWLALGGRSRCEAFVGEPASKDGSSLMSPEENENKTHLLVLFRHEQPLALIFLCVWKARNYWRLLSPSCYKFVLDLV